MKKQMVRDTNKSPLGKSGQPHRGIALNGLARMLLIFLCIADIGLGAENAATSIVLFTRPPAPYPEALDIVSLTKQSVAFAQIVRPNGAREEIPAGGIVAIIEYPPAQPDGATAQRAATALTQIDAALAKFPRAQFPQIEAKLVPLAAKWRSAQQLAAAAAIRLAATPVRPPPAIQGLTITTTDGQQFDGVTSTKVEGEILSFEHSAGVASVPLAKLTPELQRKFNYDPKVIEAAKAAKAAKIAADAQLAQATAMKQKEAEPAKTGEAKVKDQILYGDVIQKIAGDGQTLPDGLLLNVTGAIPPAVVFLVGYPEFPDAVDGDGVSVMCTPAGTYTYTTTAGARKTVRKLKYSKPR